jgi:hypothetical protein
LLYNVAGSRRPGFRWDRLWTARPGIVAGGDSPRNDDTLVCRVAAAQSSECEDGQSLDKIIRPEKRTTNQRSRSQRRRNNRESTLIDAH